MLYLLTQHETYYPRGGTADWLGVYADEDEARGHYADAAAHADEDTRVVLIALDTDGWDTVADSW